MTLKNNFCKKHIITASAALMSVASMSLYAEGPSLEVTGVVEVELGSSSTDLKAGGSDKGSDAVLATVEIGFDATINDKVSAHLLLLHEEDDTPLEVDEGTITIGDEDKVSFTAGQMYLPFGAFETNVVSDPLTLEIGETRESAIMVTANAGDISASFYLFNGNTIETGDDETLGHSGVSLAYSKDEFSVGLDYISSLGDSDSLQEALADAPDDVVATVASFVAGLALHGSYSMGDFNVILEHIAAQDAFTKLPGNPEPTATNIDFGYSFGDYSVGLSLQSTEDAEGFLPENRTLLSYSRDMYENTTVSVEYAMSDFYDTDAEDSDTTLTAQLAVEF